MEIWKCSTYHRIYRKTPNLFDSPWCSLLESYTVYLHKNPID